MELVYLKTDITSIVGFPLKDEEGNPIKDENGQDKQDFIESTYEFKLKFDKLDSLTIDENLQVCTSETIRGRNKTFNAYKKPSNITISGKFSDLQTTNVEITGNFPDEDQSGYIVATKINPAVGKKKSDYLNKLFTLMTDNSLLVNVCTFYKTYEDYIITGFNLNYSSNSTINVELTLQEVLFRDLGKTSGLSYKIVKELNDQEAEKMNNLLELLNQGKTGNV